jgi:hypothetical protein
MPLYPNVAHALGITLLLAACGAGEPDAPDGAAPPVSAGPIPEGAELPADHPPTASLPSNHPDVSGGIAAAPTSPTDDARTGTVVEALPAAGYTYALVEFDGDEIWVAGPASPIGPGDEITISGLMGMTNFYARSLDRTFDAIVFATAFTRSGEATGIGR